MNKAIVWLVIILIIIGGIIWYANQGDEVVVDENTSEEMMESEEEMSEDGSEEVSGGEVKEFSVEGNNFSFSPAEIRVNQGDTVRVTLTNPDAMPHDFVIDEFNASTRIINNGETDTVEFVADQAGTFEYYCSVGSHRAMGMVGNLIVE